MMKINENCVTFCFFFYFIPREMWWKIFIRRHLYLFLMCSVLEIKSLDLLIFTFFKNFLKKLKLENFRNLSLRAKIHLTASFPFYKRLINEKSKTSTLSYHDTKKIHLRNIIVIKRTMGLCVSYHAHVMLEMWNKLTAIC